MSETSRRSFILSAAAATAAFGLDRPVGFLTPAHAQQKLRKGVTPLPFGSPDRWAAQRFKRFKIGGLRAWMVYDGTWERPLSPDFVRNATVEDVKAALKSANLPDTYVPVPYSVLVVLIRGNYVMFDAGTGGQLHPGAGKLAENMRAAGIDPAKIKTIAISHFHPDHILGLMARDTDAQIYPNSEIIMPSAEYKYWTDASVTKPEAQRIQKVFPTWKNTRLIDGEVEIVPGVRSMPTVGHTPGHMSYVISSRRRQLIVLGDVSNLPVLFTRNPGWQGSFDMDPRMAEATRRRTFDRIIADRMLIAGYHYGIPGAGRLSKDGQRYLFRPMA